MLSSKPKTQLFPVLGSWDLTRGLVTRLARAIRSVANRCERHRRGPKAAPGDHSGLALAYHFNRRSTNPGHGYGAGTVRVLDRSVIAPVLQSILPSTVEPVPSELDAPANIFPLKLTLVPMVEDAKIAQKTLPALAPLISST